MNFAKLSLFRCAILLAAISGTIVFSGASHADTIYTDFGPGQTYNAATPPLTILGVNNPSTGNFSLSLAASFVPTADATLDSIDLPLQLINPFLLAVPPNQVTVQILATNPMAFFEPGAVLESFVVNLTVGAPPEIITVNSVLHPSLSTQSQYWIAVGSGPNAVADALWFSNSIGANGLDETLTPLNFPNWFPVNLTAKPAFDVNGTTAADLAAPEPTSILLFSTGIVGLVTRRRKFAKRLKRTL